MFCNFKILVLFIVGVTPCFGEELTDAKFIAKMYIDQTTADANTIRITGESVKLKKYNGCNTALPVLECVRTYVGSITIKSPVELTAVFKLIAECMAIDSSDNKVSKWNTALKANDSLILSLDRVDLKKSWLATYKTKYKADEAFANSTKNEVIDTMIKLREKILTRIVDNVTNVWKNESNEPDKDKLHATGLAQLKKLKPIKERSYAF